MADVVNKIIDTIEFQGGEKYQQAYAKATAAAVRHDKVIKQAQARARQPAAFNAIDTAKSYRKWDSERKLSRGTLERLRESRGRATTLPMGMSARAGVGMSFAGGLAAGGAAAAITGLGMLAKKSIEAAGATAKWKNRYESVTTAYEGSVTKLKESIGNILMPTFTKLAKDLGDAANDWALLLDPDKMKAIWKDARDPNASEIENYKRAKKLGIPYTNKYGHTVDPRKTDPTGSATPAPTFSDMRDQKKVKDDAFKQMREAQEEQEREARRQRDFQRNLQMERMIEAKSAMSPGIKDLQKYVMGGGSQAGIGITPVEMGYGPGGGGGSSANPTIRVKFEDGANEMERAMGAALGKYFEMFLGQAIRQGQIQPGSARH